MSDNTIYVDPPTVTRAQARARAARARAARLEPRVSDDGLGTSLPFRAWERRRGAYTAVTNVLHRLEPASVPRASFRSWPGARGGRARRDRRRRTPVPRVAAAGRCADGTVAHG